jgi:hypothetical protein
VVDIVIFIVDEKIDSLLIYIIISYFKDNNMKHDKYLRDVTSRRNQYKPFKEIDLSLIADYEVTFSGKLRITAKNEKEIKQVLQNITKFCENSLNSLTISNVKIIRKK